MTIRLLNTDITQLDVDAIVNAANESLLAGGAYAVRFIVPPGRNWKKLVGASAIVLRGAPC